MYSAKDKNYSLEDILRFSVGDISSHGDSGMDKTSYENLSKAELVLGWIFERLISNYDQRKSGYGSVADIGRESGEILSEMYDWLKSTLKEEDKEYSPF